jgi:ATP-binding cassette, subfamily F, member 3
VYDFIDNRNIESLKQLEAGRKAVQAGKETGESASRINWEQKKQYERELRKFQNGIEKAEKEIEKCEKEMAEMEKIIANPALDPNKIESGEVFKNYEAQKIRLAKAEKDWEQFHLELEALERKTAG